jgi:hypothetical protein
VITPCFDQNPSQVRVTRLPNAVATGSLANGVLARHSAAIPHQFLSLGKRETLPNSAAIVTAEICAMSRSLQVLDDFLHTYPMCRVSSPTTASNPHTFTALGLTANRRIGTRNLCSSKSGTMGAVRSIGANPLYLTPRERREEKWTFKHSRGI